MKVPSGLQYLASLLPCPLYIVGGYVRNALLLDGAPTDIDICSALTVEDLRRHLADTAVQLVEVNPRVGTVLVRVGEDTYEYTTFRRDSYPIGGIHTPTSVQFVATPQEDALRRDFRINAIYWEIGTGRLVDPTEGMADLAAGVVRTTRAPMAVFGEDGLRILRLARFCGQLGFAPHPDTLQAATQSAALLRDISPERIWGELQQILLADTRYGRPEGHLVGLRLLDAMGAWPYMAPVSGAIDTEGALAGYPADLTLRLAGVCRCLATQSTTPWVAFAQQWLGQRGLRCANNIVHGTVALLQAAATRPTDEAGWRVWAATHGALCPLVGYVWQDPEAGTKAAAVWQALQDAHVPLCHKDLPLAPHDLVAMGIPAPMLGKVFGAVLRYCWARLLRPTRARCTAIVQKIWRERLWNL